MLLAVADKLHGVNPAPVIDSANREFTEGAKALIRLTVLDNPEHRNALAAIRASAPVQAHLYYTFAALALVGCFEEAVLLNTGLAFTLVDHNFDKPLFLMSGTLAQWRTAVLLGCSDVVSQGTRELFNKLYLNFERLGVAEIWSGHRRTNMRDSTFTLDRA